jgi:hypothetical protein
MLGRAFAPALLAGALLACSRSQRPVPVARGSVEERGDSAVAARTIDQVLAAHTDSLMKIPGVVGTAIGLCGSERCIKVLMAGASPSVGKIPTQLEGYRVVTEIAGRIVPR